MSIWTLTSECRRLWKNAFKSSEQIQAESLASFRRIVRHAWENTVFYPAFWKEKGFCPEDISAVKPEDIPILTKQDLVEYRNKHLAFPVVDRKNLHWDRKNIVLRSSGSTGTPAQFLYSRAALTTVEANFVRLSNLGGNKRVEFRDLPVRVIHTASIGPEYASYVLLSEGLSKYHARCLLLDTRAPLEEWPFMIGDYKPNYLSGYPSCLALLLHLQKHGKIQLHPLKIVSGGEPLGQSLKKELEEYFSADVIDFYGCSESLFIGAGSSWYEGIYLFDDVNYIETDSDGHLILTPFYNRAAPLIRYKLDDIVYGFSRSYEGPQPFTHIDGIAGRDNDILWFVNEDGLRDYLHPLVLDDLSVPGLRQFQFVQTGDSSFRVDCLTEESIADEQGLSGIREAVRQQMDSLLEKKRMRNVRYEIEFPAQLLRNSISGKVPLTVR